LGGALLEHTVRIISEKDDMSVYATAGYRRRPVSAGSCRAALHAKTRTGAIRRLPGQRCLL